MMAFVNFLNADSTLDNGDPTNSTVTYDLDECDAFVLAGTIRDYSEFEGVADNDPECSQLTPISTIYRDNANVNTHSCTPGVNGTDAMCVDGLEGCAYDAGNSKSIKFDIMVMPGPSGTGNISQLSFYELAPQNYFWIAGPSGLNDYPTKYGIRVLKDGTEVFRSAELPTTQDWTLETFDFTSNPEFTVNAPAIFSFELLAYCPVGNNAGVTVWDIDHVVVTSTCLGEEIEGGSLTTDNGETNLSICANDGISDAFDVILTGATGADSAWLITDANGVILDLPASPPFDLEGAGPGVCYIWHLSYTDTLSTLSTGINVSSITGCYALSNPIIVDRNMPVGGVISIPGGATSDTICAGDGIPDPIDVEISIDTLIDNTWIITDIAGNILGLPMAPPFDLEGAGAGICQIWNLGHEGSLTGVMMGANISDIGGCFGLSNPITVTRLTASAGMISSNGETEINICAGDGMADLVDVQLSGNVGAFGSWIITDSTGLILDLPATPPFNLDGAASGVCQIWHLSYDGPINGLALGSNVSDITGCLGLSNAITVNKTTTSGGVLSYDNRTFFQFCNGDSLISSFDPVLNGNVGINLTYFITDDSGVIIDTIMPPFDLTAYGIGRFRIYALSYDSAESGIVIGQNVDILTSNCAGLSNPIIVAIELADGGTITSAVGDTLDICVQGATSIIVDLDLAGNIGAFSRWIVTDTTGNIIALPGAPPFSLDITGLSSCLVYHLSYEPSFTGLMIGNNISDFVGCYDLSNAVTVNKQTAIGGDLSFDGVTTSLDFCGTDTLSQSIDVILNNNVGENQAWVVTDTVGNILDLPMGPPFDFSTYGDGNFRLRNLSYNGGVSGDTIGGNANDLSGECFGLSNFVLVNISSVDGGMISSSLGDTISVCAGDGMVDSIDVAVTGVIGSNSAWLITDTTGNIIDIPSGPPFAIDSDTSSVCLIWHLSYESSLTGLALGNNVSALTGCYDLSNAITVNKQSSNGGDLSFDGTSTSLDFCGIDTLSQSIDVVLNNSVGENQLWVVTDTVGNILDLPMGPPFDFSTYGDGNFRLWNLSYNGAISGDTLGGNANDLSGECFGLSNFVAVNISSVDGGIISSSLGDTISVCAGDGMVDSIDVAVMGAIGNNSAWLITDAAGNIIDIPSGPPFAIDSDTSSVCLIWHLSFESLSGLQVGANAASLQGCFDLSNPIVINKTSVNGGVITSSLGDVITTCIDGINDNIDATVSGATGVNNQWVITDENGNILGLPAAPPFDFDPAGVGTCLIWNLSYENVDSLTMGNNVSQLTGCFAFSNAITVNREMKDAGDISFDSAVDTITICAGDSIPDALNVNVSGGDTLGNFGWLITDENLNILALPMAPPFDLDGAGAGTCLIWRICYSNLSGLAVGGNAGDLEGCFDLSNALTVERVEYEESSIENSTALFGLESCDSDTATGTNEDYSEFTGAVNNSSECTTFEIVEGVHRTDPSTNPHSCTPGVNGSVAMCVSPLPSCDFMDDNNHAIRFSVNVTPATTGQSGLNSLSFYEKAPITYEWINGASGINNFPTRYGIRVLKDGVEIFKQDDIITTSDWTLESFDFSTNPAFFVDATTRFDFELLAYCRIENGAAVSAWDIDEILIGSSCTTGLNSGILSTVDGMTELEICADDGTSDAFNTIVLNAAGQNAAWVITDENLNILDLPMGPPFDFEGAGAGVCLVWYLTYSDGLVGAEIGLNVQDLQGCYALSNAITVTRQTGLDCGSNIIEDDEEEEEATEPELVESFEVLPNPAVSMLTIKTDNLPMVGTKMVVYDRMGQVVATKDLTDQSTNLMLENFSSGIYYIKILSGKFISSQSFIKI